MNKTKRKLFKHLILKEAPSHIYDSAFESPIKSFFYKAGTQLLTDKNFPIQINLEVSRSCNYDCPFCARKDAPEGKHIPFDYAQKVILEANKFGPTTFALHMWGEPLINPHWGEIVEFISSQPVDHGTTMTTNGYLLNEGNIEKIFASGLSQIIISLHTLDPEEYKLRVGKDIDVNKVLKNLKNLSTYQKENNLNISKIVRLFRTKDQPENDASKLKELENLGYSIEEEVYDNSANFIEGWSEVEVKSKRHPCYHPFLTLTVTVQGDVTVCCVDANHSLKIGNIKESSVYELWTGKKINQMRNEHLSNNFTSLCEICKKCDTWADKPDFFFNFQKK
tara:strand:- start:79154 stop:80161 length:1008 start_codon:yes stop_codon:yes gene_type:complete